MAETDQFFAIHRSDSSEMGQLMRTPRIAGRKCPGGRPPQDNLIAIDLDGEYAGVGNLGTRSNRSPHRRDASQHRGDHTFKQAPQIGKSGSPLALPYDGRS